MGVGLLIATPFFVFFGALSDRVGRLKVSLTGCALAALTYFPLFKTLTHAVNPALEKFQAATPITGAAGDCHLHVFVLPGTKFTPCDRTKDFLTKSGLSFTSLPPAGDTVVTTIGEWTIHGYDTTGFRSALTSRGYPAKANKAAINYPLTILVLVIMVIYVAIVYGPIAAFLVELFPTNIRYTSMSFPYHIGNGWFGGMLPLLATALVAAHGDIYYGLWYPIVVAVLTVIIGALFLRDPRQNTSL